MSAQSAVVTGVGMVTPVGPDAKSSCAAFRAGIVRPVQLEYLGDLEGEDEEPDYIIGLVAAPRAMEAEGIGKMLGLGVGAIRDLHYSNGAPDENTRLATGLYVALPDYSYRAPGESDDSVNATQDAAGEEEEIPRSDEFATACDEHLCERLLKLANLELNVTTRRIAYGDQCTFLTLLGEASRDLHAGKIGRCIVGGIDSFLDPESLDWAYEQGRLKTADTPCGFWPGEAAVFIDIRSPGAVAEEQVLGVLVSPELAEEPTNSAAPEGPLGVGLALAIEKVLASAGDLPIGLVIGDLNGEIRRARDWGYAVNRLVGRFPYLIDVPCWYPAESFGETGCASPGLAIGVGIRAFQRGYARTERILIWSSSQTSLRGAVCLMSP